MEHWHIFGETLAPGEKKQLVLRVPMGDRVNCGVLLPEAERGGGDYELPAILLNGARPGKTLLVTAGIHSGEFAGIPAVIRTAEELDPAEMSGRAILLPCVNTSGFWTLNPATVPEDGFNLNHDYPGRADGTVGERLAAFFVRELFPRVDFILDFHGGSHGERMTPLVFFPTAPGVREASLRAALSMNLGYIIESEATRGEYSYAANHFDVPGLLLERGEGYFCDEDWVEADRRDLRLLMDHLGLIPAPAGTRDQGLRRRVFREAIYLDAMEDGLWYPAVGKDEDVKQGQLLGVMEDLFGNRRAEYRAEKDGHTLYLSRGLAVPGGGFLLAYAVAASEVR